MNGFAHSLPIRAGSIAACLTATGLVLAACGNSGGSAGGGSNASNAGSSNVSNAGGSTATKSAGAGSGNSGSGGSGSGSASVVSSNSLPFPVAVGNTWVYRQTVGGVVLQTNKITAIKPAAGGEKVYMGRTYYIFHSDGSITLPLNQFKTNGAVLKVLRGTLEWPPASVISSGQPTASVIEMSANLAGHAVTMTSHVTVKGDGTQSVTVPAGTYSATVVDMIENFTVLGQAGKLEIKSWVANGVGPVQTEVFSYFAGIQHLTSKTVLVSFKKG